MREKDLFKLFNYMNNDEKEFENIKDGMNDIQKSNLKSNLRKTIKCKKHSRKKYIAIAAAISICCVIGVNVNSGFAKDIPILNSVMQTITNKYDGNEEYDKYSKPINKTAEDKGIKFTVNEAVCDDSQLVISCTLNSSKKIKVDNEDISSLFLGNYISINGKKERLGGGMQWENVDDNTIIGVCELDVDNKKLGGDFKVDLNVDKILNTSGKWDVSFNVSKKALEEKTLKVKPNIKVDFPNNTLIVDKVSLNPINTSIFIKGKYKNKESQVKIKGYNLFDYGHWIVLDDKGVELFQKGSSGQSQGIFNINGYKYKLDLESLKQTPKYLTVIPCEFIRNTEEKNKFKVPINGQYPIKINQGKMGNLIINDIKNEDNKTIIKYTADGQFPYNQANKLFVKDEKGNELKVYNMCKRRKNRSKPREFELEIERLQENQKYFLCSNTVDNIKPMKKYMFKIPITK